MPVLTSLYNLYLGRETRDKIFLNRGLGLQIGIESHLGLGHLRLGLENRAVSNLYAKVWKWQNLVALLQTLEMANIGSGSRILITSLSETAEGFFLVVKVAPYPPRWRRSRENISWSHHLAASTWSEKSLRLCIGLEICAVSTSARKSRNGKVAPLHYELRRCLSRPVSALVTKNARSPPRSQKTLSFFSVSRCLLLDLEIRACQSGRTAGF